MIHIKNNRKNYNSADAGTNQPSRPRYRVLGSALVLAMLIASAISMRAQSNGLATASPQHIALKAWYVGNEAVGFSGSPYNFNQPGGLTTDGANIYVSNGGNGNIVKLRASDGQYLGVLATTTDPGAMAFDGHRIWVANHNTGNPHSTVSIYDASTGAFVRSVTVGSNPDNMVWDGWGMWIPANDGTVKRIDNSGGTMCSRQVTGGPDYGVAFDGNYTWVTSINTNQVIKLDYTCTQQGTAISVPGGPVGIVFDGTNMWTANYYNNTVAKITPGGVVTEFPVGAAPWQVAFDGAFIYAGNVSGKTVTKLPVNTVTGSPSYTIYPCNGASNQSPLDLAFDGASVWASCPSSNMIGKM